MWLAPPCIRAPWFEATTDPFPDVKRLSPPVSGQLPPVGAVVRHLHCPVISDASLASLRNHDACDLDLVLPRGGILQYLKNVERDDLIEIPHEPLPKAILIPYQLSLSQRFPHTDRQVTLTLMEISHSLCWLAVHS